MPTFLLPISHRVCNLPCAQEEDDLQRVLAVNAADSLARDVLSGAGSAPAALVDLLFNQALKQEESHSLPAPPAQLLTGTGALSHGAMGPPTRYRRVPADVGLAMQLQQEQPACLQGSGGRPPRAAALLGAVHTQ